MSVQRSDRSGAAEQMAAIPADAIAAARRIVAVDDGTPGADDEIEYLDAVAVSRALLAVGGHAPRRDWTLARAARLFIWLAAALIGAIFTLLILLPPGKMP